MFEANFDTGELFIYAEIGPADFADWGLVNAKQVMGALAELDGDPVTVRLNTPGGSVDEGIAIYNALDRYKGRVTTVVDSLAASMGSYLAQAGSTRIVADNAMMMIHDPWSIAIGNADTLAKEAEVLRKYSQRMVPVYASKSGQTEEHVKSWMAGEEWFIGEEIVDAGLADEVTAAKDIEPVTAGLQRVAKHIPEQLRQRRFKLHLAKQRIAAMRGKK